ALPLWTNTSTDARRPVASLCCCKCARLRFPVVVSLCGVHLLGDRLVSAFVSHPLEALTVELVEADAVGLVRDEEVEDGPHEREAAFLTGEATHHLCPPLHL